MPEWIELPQGGWREEWVNAAFKAAAREAGCIPGAAPMYVAVACGPAPSSPRLAGQWGVDAVGLAFQPPTDPQVWAPIWRQAADEQKTCLFREEHPSGYWRLCLATPHPSGLRLVRVRDLLAVKVGTPVRIFVHQRMDSREPTMLPLGLEHLPPRDWAGVIREGSHFFAPPARTGPVPRPAGEPPPPNWPFLRLLEETVVNLIDTSEGDTPTLAGVRKAMANMDKDTFRRRRESLRITDDQLEACIIRLVMDYSLWRDGTTQAERHKEIAGLPDPEWKPRRSLRELLTAESAEFARLLRHEVG